MNRSGAAGAASMSSVAIWILAFALACVAGALMLLQRGAVREGRADAQRFIDSRLESSARAVAPAPITPMSSDSRARGARSGTTQPPVEGIERWRRRLVAEWGNFSNRAGLDQVRPLFITLVAVGVVLTLWAGVKGGPLAAGAGLIGSMVIIVLWLTTRIQRRRLRIVRQLPSFLDGMVRLVTIGNSVPAAFQAALQTTEEPLRDGLDHVSRLLRTGVEIDRAMIHVARLYRIKEFELVGSVLRLSVKYGGRADVMLERMSTFMRDLEQAERELAAMSSETRVSAMVLGLLPIAVACFVIAVNPSYFGTMWMDPSGRRLIYLAFLLQAAGGYWLHRLSRLR